jgi:hypothetical protein
MWRAPLSMEFSAHIIAGWLEEFCSSIRMNAPNNNQIDAIQQSIEAGHRYYIRTKDS